MSIEGSYSKASLFAAGSRLTRCPVRLEVRRCVIIPLQKVDLPAPAGPVTSTAYRMVDGRVNGGTEQGGGRVDARAARKRLRILPLIATKLCAQAQLSFTFILHDDCAATVKSHPIWLSTARCPNQLSFLRPLPLVSRSIPVPLNALSPNPAGQMGRTSSSSPILCSYRRSSTIITCIAIARPPRYIDVTVGGSVSGKKSRSDLASPLKKMSAASAAHGRRKWMRLNSRRGTLSAGRRLLRLLPRPRKQA